MSRCFRCVLEVARKALFSVCDYALNVIIFSMGPLCIFPAITVHSIPAYNAEIKNNSVIYQSFHEAYTGFQFLLPFWRAKWCRAGCYHNSGRVYRRPSGLDGRGMKP